jgi:hypothetical protein
MNEVLNDIEKLEKLENLLWEKDLSNGFSRNAISIYIQEMIEEKQKSVTEFEKQAPNHIQDLCNQLRGAI